MQIEIINLSEIHTLAKVTTRQGYVYACTYAPSDEYERPTEEHIRRDWRASRRSFRPYDESTGRYLA